MRHLATAALLIAISVPSAHAGVRNFFLPEINGTRVDACLAGGLCGKPAADAYCKAQGYDHATIFQREGFASTQAIDSGRRCEGGSCTAFRQVKCFTTKTDLAGL
jgi:hypothetical protein